MYKSAFVHLKNKFPGSNVIATDHSLDVYDADGTHRVALRKNGAGQWADAQKEFGATEQFCLAPIPKQSRVHKLFKDGSVGLSEEHESRSQTTKALCVNGRVLSIQELTDAGAQFDHAGNVTGAAKQIAAKSLDQVMKDADQF